MDLRMLTSGARVYACITQPIYEDNYLEAATLSLELARQHGLEVAQFTASNTAKQCLGIDDWTTATAAAATVVALTITAVGVGTATNAGSASDAEVAQKHLPP